MISGYNKYIIKKPHGTPNRTIFMENGKENKEKTPSTF